jgi:type II secretory pathway pseudopilin PulG
LLELVIVVVIVGIIAAIAIPRMSRGTAGAADSALSANLAVLRNAIDLYAAEHGGTYPAATTVADQLTKYTNASGTTNDTRTTEYIYGPYVRTIPTLPVGAKKGNTGIAAADAAGVGWIYSATPGTVTANTADTEKDVTGKAYNTY